MSNNKSTEIQQLVAAILTASTLRWLPNTIHDPTGAAVKLYSLILEELITSKSSIKEDK